MDQPATPNRPDLVNPAAPAPVPPPPPEPAAPEEVAPPPLTTAGWFRQNGLYLLIAAVIAGMIYYRHGVDGLVNAAILVVGLGFVVFIHELGHFLAAKWCDIHVQTFSVGFGPPLPGCSFRYGETFYKLAVIPLGGYVAMVGEGFETEEGEDYPRSFKNKSVAARMVVISAGVVMNLLFGALVFFFVFYTRGEDYLPPTVSRVDAGSPAWQKGLRSGMVITRINRNDDPTYTDLKYAAALSASGEKISVALREPGASPGAAPRVVELEPRADENDRMPAVGLALVSSTLQLIPRDERAPYPPYLPGSAAAAARAIDAAPGAALVDPAGLAARLRAEPGKPVEYRVRQPSLFPSWRQEGPDVVTREAPAEPGFRTGARLGGVTDPAQADGDAYDPLRLLTPLPDVFAFKDALRRLAGRPVVVAVERADAPAGAAPELVFVPPAYHYTFGLRMQMGKVAGVRDGSPAAAAGVQPGDVLTRVVLIEPVEGTDGKEHVVEDFDPLKLPYLLAAKVRGRSGWKARLTVVRFDPAEKKDAPKALPAVDWEAGWASSDEAPINRFSPMSISELGLAYWVQSVIDHVEPGSPADKAGLRKDDRIDEILFKTPKKKPGEFEWDYWMPLKSKRGKADDVYDEWAFVVWWLQMSDAKEVRVKLRPRADLTDAQKSEGIELTAVEDPSWPAAAERGLRLAADRRLRKPDGILDAARMSWRWTTQHVVGVYLQIRSLLTGRISTKNLQGPISIVDTAFSHADAGLYPFLLFLALISISLAVFNFLPIPLLDGGHMAFLIYEAIRRKPPSETVRMVLTYGGLLCILALMVFVFYQDISRLLFGNG